MYTAIKGLILFLSIIVIMPIVFFALISFVGKLFLFKVTKDSWLCRTKIKFIRSIGDYYLKD